jgi:SAM-dependent methyltransferase
VGDPVGRRSVFDSAAGLYDQARPEYPASLFDALVRMTGAGPGDRVLEIGPATGKATAPLAERGLRITCVELGPELAARARAALAAYSQVEVVHGAFEDWSPPDGASYDLVVAATSWHWLDPSVRYRKAFDVLRPGGHLAFWRATHVFPDAGDPFFRELQDIYDEIGEGLLGGAVWPRPGELADEAPEIEASGLFDVVGVEQFDWEVVYDADGYIELLDTFSGHIAMQPGQRDRLYGEIRRRLAKRPDGLLRRHWGAVLHVARPRTTGARPRTGPGPMGSRLTRRAS